MPPLLLLPRRSLFGLNAANFFQAEMVGVVLPVLSAFLHETGWRYDSIGFATAAAGVGALLFQTPAGVLTDRIVHRRLLFAATSMVTGLCFALLPSLVGSHVWTITLLTLSGIVQTFFGPILGALALALVGHSRLSLTMGSNQGWNHAGNIASALIAMGLVSLFGKSSIFYAVAVSSLFAAAVIFLIRSADLHEYAARGFTRPGQSSSHWKSLLSQRHVLPVVACIFLFHLANAPILPLTALYVKKLGGSDQMMTATVLSAQCVMVPTALLAGYFANRFGWKIVMAAAFWILPLRIFLYTLARTPKAVVFLQSLDGIGAGIYGVVVIVIAAELTRGKGHFNALSGIFATGVAIGGVVGPLLSGVILQHSSFAITFYAFAALSVLGALGFQFLVPSGASSSDPAQAQGIAAGSKPVVPASGRLLDRGGIAD